MTDVRPRPLAATLAPEPPRSHRLVAGGGRRPCGAVRSRRCCRPPGS
ncbi:hypothetical protein KIF24_03600 [Micromonospora sp. Llam7]|nr:hypothetical protein [Micromonospora tarapacensis]MBX7265229.1 hypothetical protein [Micromonospora tarapacensis]